MSGDLSLRRWLEDSCCNLFHRRLVLRNCWLHLRLSCSSRFISLFCIGFRGVTFLCWLCGFLSEGLLMLAMLLFRGSGVPFCWIGGRVDGRRGQLLLSENRLLLWEWFLLYGNLGLHRRWLSLGRHFQLCRMQGFLIARDRLGLRRYLSGHSLRLFQRPFCLVINLRF